MQEDNLSTWAARCGSFARCERAALAALPHGDDAEKLLGAA